MWGRVGWVVGRGTVCSRSGGRGNKDSVCVWCRWEADVNARKMSMQKVQSAAKLTDPNCVKRWGCVWGRGKMGRRERRDERLMGG